MYYNGGMRIFIYIVIVAAILFAGYKYFHLDQNKTVQQSLQNKDYTTAENAIKTAIQTQLTTQAKQYLHDHNNYFVSTSNNLCTSAKSLFSGLEQFTSNPVECVAQVHSFTARIKLPASDGYYCADPSGFYTIATTEEGYLAGVKCK
jgi:hypothetical protein